MELGVGGDLKVKAVAEFLAQKADELIGVAEGAEAGAAHAGYRPAVAAIGDSTFSHGGITPLMSAVQQNVNLNVLVVDNSTVGMTALARGRPTIALGNAIYDMPGLTCQDGLDRFWQSPPVPDQDLLTRFRDTVIHATQLNGDLYTREGIRQALDGCDRLLDPKAPLQRLLAKSPPGQAPSRRMESA